MKSWKLEKTERTQGKTCYETSDNARKDVNAHSSELQKQIVPGPLFVSQIRVTTDAQGPLYFDDDCEMKIQNYVLH